MQTINSCQSTAPRRPNHVGRYMAVLSLSYLLCSCCTPEIGANVPNTLRPQETDNWCWAATTQMLAQHFGIAISQCDLANQVWGKGTCCSASVLPNAGCRRDTSCNHPGNLQLDRVGLKFTETGTALTWESLREQLYCQKKPMGYAYGWAGHVGHVLVIKGYITVGPTNYLILNDPWGPCQGQERLVTYQQYVHPGNLALNDSTAHWSTYHNLAKK